MTGFIAMLALSFAITGADTPADTTASSGGDSDVVAVRIDAMNRMTVPVAIGDSGTFRFLVDTGSQNTVMSTELAARLSLAPSLHGRIVGTAGETPVEIIRLDGLTLGSRRFNHLVVPLLRQTDIGADGVVGLDSLQRQRVLVDFGSNLMTIEDADRPHGNGFDIVVTARRRSGQLIMTDARIDGIHVDVVIDTGSDGTIGNLALAAALSRRRTLVPTVLHSITGQSILANSAIERELILGPLRLSNVTVTYADAPPFGLLGLKQRPAIFLGLSELRAFRRVAIDFNRRKVMFELDKRPQGIAQND